ncbi:DUF167 domain-containing protein [Candidatus Saccharibacteria bacterium]|nr:DUF167 domain-containing protein [Candidatus Saccharibacteria bacterium]
MKYTVQVKPGSKNEGVELLEGGSLVVRTHARAHDGEANTAVIKLLAKHFKTAKSNLKIVAGEKSRRKVVDVL